MIQQNIRNLVSFVKSYYLCSNSQYSQRNEENATKIEGIVTSIEPICISVNIAPRQKVDRFLETLRELEQLGLFSFLIVLILKRLESLRNNIKIEQNLTNGVD